MHVQSLLIIYLLFSYSSSADAFFNYKKKLEHLCQQLELTPDQCCMADKFFQFVGYGGLAAAVSTYGIPFVLGQLGFSATGVIGGSFAAHWQSFRTLPHLFSIVQRASMTGAASAIATKLGVTAAAVKAYFSSCNTETTSEATNRKKH